MIIGGLARVLRGSDELARGVDIWPALTANNNERLAQTGLELDSHVGDRRRRTVEEIALAGEDVVELRTSAGELKLISAPAGVPNGFADLRRAATREDLGNRLRPLVASTADLRA